MKALLNLIFTLQLAYSLWKGPLMTNGGELSAYKLNDVLIEFRNLFQYHFAASIHFFPRLEILSNLIFNYRTFFIESFYRSRG